MRYLQLENICRRILIWISKTLPENEIFAMYQYVVFVLKDPFYRRKFFLLTRLQNDFILYIIRKNILIIHISTEIFFNVISFVFHFERLISQKKILLIHISPEGYKKQFFWTISIFAEGNHCLILLQKESLQCINILFSFERFISQKRIRLIDSSSKGFQSVYRIQIFLIIDIFSERYYFLVLL